MGIMLNPKNICFKEAVKSEIYVDKTELIKFANEKMNTLQKIFALAVQDVLVNQLLPICLWHIIVKGVILKNYLASLKLPKIKVLRSI